MPPFESATITFENGNKLTATYEPNKAKYYDVHFYRADGTEDNGNQQLQVTYNLLTALCLHP